MKIQYQKVCIKLKNYVGLKIKVLLPPLKPQMMCAYMIFDQVLKRFHELRFLPLHLDELIYVSKQCRNVFRNFVLRLIQLLPPFFYFYSFDNSVQGSKPHFSVPLHVHVHDYHNVHYSSINLLLGEQRVTKRRLPTNAPLKRGVCSKCKCKREREREKERERDRERESTDLRQPRNNNMESYNAMQSIKENEINRFLFIFSILDDC